MVLLQAIQFSISARFSSIWTIDRTLSGATQSEQYKPGSDGNKGLIHITQSTSITGTSPSDFVSYPGHSLGVVSPLCREAVGVFYSPSWLGKVGAVLSNCREAVGVFYSPSPLSHSLWGVLLSVEEQYVYSIAPGDWPTLGAAPPLQRSNLYFRQPQSTGPQETHW